MGKFLESLKSKFAGRKVAKQSKLTFRQWCKANGHEVGQYNIGSLMRQFIESTKPGKAGVRAAIAAEVATAISGKVPAVVDHEALDEVTKASAKGGSHAAIALRASLSMEPELPPNLEADLDRVSSLLDSGKQAEGLRLLKVTLESLPTTLSEAKSAPKKNTGGSGVAASSGNPISTPNAKSSGTSFPPRSKAEGVSLSAPSVAKPSRIATSPKPAAAGDAVQLSDKPANSSEANRRERVKRLLADCGVPVDSTESVIWSELGEKNLRSLSLLFKRKLDAARTWRERGPLEDEVLSVLAGNGQPVDVFRKYKFLADDSANNRTILR